MGQAKNRGTYEDRRKQAIQRDEEQRRRSAILQEDAWNNLTGAERRRRIQSAALLSTVLGSADYAASSGIMVLRPGKMPPEGV